MAIFDYRDQLNEEVNIANPLEVDDPNAYEYQLADTIGKEPDLSLTYYIKDNTDKFVEYPAEYEEVDTSKPPVFGETYYKFDKNKYVLIGSVTKFETNNGQPVQYFTKKDIEFDPRVKYYIKVRNKFGHTTTTKFELISQNHPYLEYFARAIYCNTVGEILSRHVLKFTKLREDIIFIKLCLIKPGTAEKGKILTIAVNETSFWNRLIFYKTYEPGMRFLPKDNYDPYDLLLMKIHKSASISRIVFKLVDGEAEKIQHLYDMSSDDKEGQNKILSYNIVNNANVEILGFEHYSKLLWLAYFNSIYNSSDDKVISPYDKSLLGQLDYKDQSNVAFYNPDDEAYSDHKLFYK